MPCSGIKSGEGEEEEDDGVLASKVAIAQLLCLWEEVSDLLCLTWVFPFFPSPVKLSQLVSFPTFVLLVLPVELESSWKRYSCEHINVNTAS